MPVRVVRRLGLIDVVTVADGENVRESFDLQVFVDLQSTAFSHVISWGHKCTDKISQNTLLLTVMTQDCPVYLRIY